MARQASHADAGVTASLTLALLLLATGAVRAQASVTLRTGMSRNVIVFQTQYGDIHIGLFEREAPQTVAHVLELVELGAYNTVPITWISHNLGAKVNPVLDSREVPLSAVQRMAAEKTVPLELTSYSHKAGYVTMVRGTDPDSAMSAFTFVLADAPALDGRFSVFGRVLRGMDILSRSLKGFRHVHTLPIHSAHIYTVEDDHTKHCDDDLVEFYLSDQWHQAVPLKEECLSQRIHMPRPYPRSTTVLMKGLPKMGTTWTEVFVGRLMEEICSNSTVYHCHAQTTSRGAVAVFVKNQGENVGTALQWKCETKHDFPMSVAPDAPDNARVGAFYDFDRGVLAPWEECLQNRKYTDYEACLPSWHALPDYEVFMDQRAHDAMEDFGGPEWAIEDEADQLKKYILVVRDPRDATVSLMHYHHEGADNEKLQEDTRKYIKHYVTWLGFWYWYQTRYVSPLYPTMILVYRDVKEDPVREYSRVLDYMGLKASEELVKRVVDETDFENMRKMEYQRLLPGRNRAKGDNRKVRSGQAQGFYSELTPETIEYCNQVMRDLLPPELLARFDVQ